MVDRLQSKSSDHDITFSEQDIELSEQDIKFPNKILSCLNKILSCADKIIFCSDNLKNKTSMPLPGFRVFLYHLTFFYVLYRTLLKAKRTC